MEQPISSIRPAAGTAPAEPIRPTSPEGSRKQEAAPRAEAPLQEAAARTAQAVEPAELEAAAERLNDFMRHSSKLHFEVGEGHLTVQVVDTSTDEVIRSIPSEKLLEIRDHFRELTGILLDDQA